MFNPCYFWRPVKILSTAGVKIGKLQPHHQKQLFIAPSEMDPPEVNFLRIYFCCGSVHPPLLFLLFFWWHYLSSIIPVLLAGYPTGPNPGHSTTSPKTVSLALQFSVSTSCSPVQMINGTHLIWSNLTGLTSTPSASASAWSKVMASVTSWRKEGELDGFHRFIDHVPWGWC